MRLITIILLLIATRCFAPELSADQKERYLETHIKELENRKLYNKVIEFTKETEGCILKPYRCPAGHWTIGYGHMIRSGENFWGGITQEQADSLLIVDFNERLIKVPECHEYGQRLAIAHFIFNLGIGSYTKSKLKKRIDSGYPIDDLIVRYCHYKSNGKYVKSTHLLKARKFELKIYNNERT